MKYWRGYLVAAIFAAMSWGLAEFAKAHWELVDMVYPYVSRLIQNYLVDWSAGINFCLWQILLMVGGVLVLASIVLMVVFKWNPIQWFGWVVAAVCVVGFFNMAIFGLNDYAGPLADDVRLEMSEYTIGELEDAGQFYLNKANTLAPKVARNGDGTLNYPAFQELAVQAADGFETQTYDKFNAVFAGSTVPVKELGWEELFAGRGITGLTVGITGESAVHAQTPAMALPFVMCREMAKRMCITNDQDAIFAAFMACDANASVEFQYAAYFMAYRYCSEALKSMEIAAAQTAATKLSQLESSLLKRDLEEYNNSFAAGEEEALVTQEEGGAKRYNVVDMLVNWHIQEYVLPALVEEEVVFDPMDETQVDLTGLPHAEIIYDEEDTD